MQVLHFMNETVCRSKAQYWWHIYHVTEAVDITEVEFELLVLVQYGCSCDFAPESRALPDLYKHFRTWVSFRFRYRFRFRFRFRQYTTRAR